MRSIQRSRVAIVAALAALAVAGCEKADDAAVELDPSEFPTSVDDKPVLKVRGTGSGDKRKLRLEPKPGLKQELTFEMKGGTGPMKMDVTMKMDSEVTRVSGGTFDVAAQFTDMKMRGQPGGDEAAEMVKEMMKDMKLTWTFTDRGDVEGMKSAGMLAAMMDQSFQQLFLSLPEEPVGVGAKWVVNDLVTNQGLTVRQQLRYEVKKISGTRVELDMAVTQRAGAQSMGMADLEELKSSGKGLMVIDTSKALPQRMKLDLKIEMAIKVGGKSESMDTRFDFDWTTK